MIRAISLGPVAFIVTKVEKAVQTSCSVIAISDIVFISGTNKYK